MKQRIGYCSWVLAEDGRQCGIEIEGPARGAIPKYCVIHRTQAQKEDQRKGRETKKQKRKEEELFWRTKGRRLYYTIRDLQQSRTPEEFAKQVNEILTGKKLYKRLRR